MSTLKLDNIVKIYPNGAVAVKGISLEVQDGQFVSLLGPSGCGKSTTLRMIAGLEEITNGDMYIGEKRVNTLQPKDRGIAMVFQSYALFPHMTVEANIGFGLKIKKVDEVTKRKTIDWALDLLDLKGLEKRRPAQLSGGQRQRVALGRALVLSPDVLLLDEPLSNLDAKLRVKMRTEIKRIHKKTGATTIYVTHDQEEAMTLSDMIIIMKKGEIMQIGTPLEIYNHPANRFVADFIGNPPFNFIDGTMEKIREDYCFTYVNGTLTIPKEQNERVESLAQDHQISIAFRPEDVIVHDKPVENTVKAVFCVRETIGSEDFVSLEVGNKLIKIRVLPTAVIPTDKPVYLEIKPNKLYVFEKEQTI